MILLVIQKTIQLLASLPQPRDRSLHMGLKSYELDEILCETLTPAFYAYKPQEILSAGTGSMIIHFTFYCILTLLSFQTLNFDSYGIRFFK